MSLRDEILAHIQLRGRCSARDVAQALGRNEKLVMRTLSDLADKGLLVFDTVGVMRMRKLRYWTARREPVRFYRLPIRDLNKNPWEERWVKG